MLNFCFGSQERWVFRVMRMDVVPWEQDPGWFQHLLFCVPLTVGSQHPAMRLPVLVLMQGQSHAWRAQREAGFLGTSHRNLILVSSRAWTLAASWEEADTSLAVSTEHSQGPRAQCWCGRCRVSSGFAALYFCMLWDPRRIRIEKDHPSQCI